MTNRRAQIAATATVLGLGALGGVALGTNHGVPAATQGVAGSTSVVTSASGAVAPASQPVALHSTTTRPPIVTRASGGGRLGGAGFDD